MTIGKLRVEVLKPMAKGTNIGRQPVEVEPFKFMVHAWRWWRIRAMWITTAPVGEFFYNISTDENESTAHWAATTWRHYDEFVKRHTYVITHVVITGDFVGAKVRGFHGTTLDVAVPVVNRANMDIQRVQKALARAYNIKHNELRSKSMWERSICGTVWKAY